MIAISYVLPLQKQRWEDSSAGIGKLRANQPLAVVPALPRTLRPGLGHTSLQPLGVLADYLHRRHPLPGQPASGDWLTKAGLSTMLESRRESFKKHLVQAPAEISASVPGITSTS